MILTCPPRRPLPRSRRIRRCPGAPCAAPNPAHLGRPDRVRTAAPGGADLSASACRARRTAANSGHHRPRGSKPRPPRPAAPATGPARIRRGLLARSNHSDARRADSGPEVFVRPPVSSAGWPSAGAAVRLDRSGGRAFSTRAGDQQHRASRTADGLVIDGEVANLGGASHDVPRLRVALQIRREGDPVRRPSIPPKAQLQPGEASPFRGAVRPPAERRSS